MTLVADKVACVALIRTLELNINIPDQNIVVNKYKIRFPS